VNDTEITGACVALSTRKVDNAVARILQEIERKEIERKEIERNEDWF